MYDCLKFRFSFTGDARSYCVGVWSLVNDHEGPRGTSRHLIIFTVKMDCSSKDIMLYQVIGYTSSKQNTNKGASNRNRSVNMRIIAIKYISFCMQIAFEIEKAFSIRRFENVGFQ